MFKVRFNLGGDNHLTWRIENLTTGEVQFLRPSEVRLRLSGCKLVNQVGTAKKIYEGADKTPCAWIICDDVYINTAGPPVGDLVGIIYNPKRLPFWTWTKSEGQNIDGAIFKEMTTLQNKLFTLD